MSVTPGWLKLLQAWTTRSKEGDRGGLTLAYLTGALALHAGNANPTIDDAKKILDDIEASSASVEARRCKPLDSVVLGWVDSGPPGLTFTEELKDWLKTSDRDELRRRLLSGAEPAIRTRQFSRVPGSDGPTADIVQLDTEVEIPWIKQVLRD